MQAEHNLSHSGYSPVSGPLALPHKHSDYHRISVSVGGITCGFAPKDWRSMIKQADENLYQAKAQGRNKAICTVEQGSQPQ
ncbi:GGDEF domain protein [Pseudoalteromonas sp. THAF3]|uniref:diguanylate cyclase domain-containing protein n=1 Tax=Pseudoalteromonas sp. THAF3 TaxID=2587843 RepID=UPI001267A20D|nr:diguanylate cyclase [Pseudoalteromonas sp. THAF3]QFU04369.1 GGDEF domain protein [Pseudoalteromonas sp. THAF3]